jgi:hypothetical protein
LEDRKISYQEAAEFASKYKFPFYESSAKTNHNVQDIFFQCVRLFWEEKIIKENEEKLKNKKKVKKGLFDSISENDDIEIKFKKN